MTNTLQNYTTRANVEAFLNRTFTEVSNTEFNNYLLSSEAYIHSTLGYQQETTTSGILAETVTREKHRGKINNFGNLVIDLYKPPLLFDVNGNPYVTLLEYNLGAIRIPLTLTDGTANALNTILESDERRRRIVYPSLYFLPAISTVTPTAKMNLFNLRDVEFFVDVSYTGGFRIVPADIIQAANLITAWQILNRDNPNFAVMVRQGSMMVEYLKRSGSYVKGQPVNEFLANANSLLSPYVRNAWY